MREMKPFDQLTYQGQVRRLRGLGKRALEAFGMSDARMTLIAHAENATFRIDAPQVTSPAPYVPGRFLLRIHRTAYQTHAEIASELTWLAALRLESELVVPDPVPTAGGDLLTRIEAEGFSEPRTCSLLRWIPGRFFEASPRPRHLEAMGELMARLHNHVDRWSPPNHFRRRRWDADGLFGARAGFCRPPDEIWNRVPAPHRTRFSSVAHQIADIMEAIGDGPHGFGLLHADLHLGNVLFRRGEARAIDFDDCGYGHWVYDFAVPLADMLDRNDWPIWDEAIRRGYGRHRPLPQRQLKQLPIFMAARLVSLMLWVTDRAIEHPRFRDRLSKWYAWASGHIERLQTLPPP